METHQERVLETLQENTPLHHHMPLLQRHREREEELYREGRKREGRGGDAEKV